MKKEKKNSAEEDELDEDLEDDEDEDDDAEAGDDDESDDDDKSDEDDDDSEEEDAGDDDDEEESDDEEEGDDSDKTPVSAEKHRQTVAQKKHFRTKYLKLKRKLEQQDTKKRPPAKKSPVKGAEDEYAKERSDFRFDYPDLKTSTVDQIEAYARGKGVPMRRAVKDSVIKYLIKKAKKRSRNAKSSTDSGFRTVPSKTNKDDWAGKSREELEAEAQRRRDAARAGK